MFIRSRMYLSLFFSVLAVALAACGGTVSSVSNGASSSNSGPSSNNSSGNSSQGNNYLSDTEREALLSNLLSSVYIGGQGGETGGHLDGIPHLTINNDNVSLGDTIFITGENYRPNEFHAIGIYARKNTVDSIQGQLVSTTIAETNSQGKLSFGIDLDSKYSNGEYIVSTSLAIDSGEMDATYGAWFTIGEPISYSSNSASNNSSTTSSNSDSSSNISSDSSTSSSIAIFTCSGAPATRLDVGFRARVTYTDGTPGSVRSAPASSQILGKVAEGTGMTVTGGPKCNNQRVWWKVETDNGYEGWISEGKSGEYWLEPAN